LKLLSYIGTVGLILFCNLHVAQAERLDAIAAIVNGEVITCYEVEQAYQGLKTQLQQSGNVLPDYQVLFERAMESRIQRILQHQEAKRLGLRVTEEEVDAAMADVEQRNNLRPGQLLEVLQAQGIDVDEYRETLKDRILNSRLVNVAVRSKLSVSEEAKREYYRKHLKNPKPVREVRTSQMFIALPANADSDTVAKQRAKAEAYYQRFLAGEDFEQIVTLESDAPNAVEGGDMGWVSQGGVKGAFTQIFDVPVGGITKPIRSAAGFHIIKVMDERMRMPERLQPYDEVRARHILLQVPPSADVDTQIKIRQQAEKIAQEMQGTSDEAFAVRAKELSQGPSATKGGDLGWFRRGQMVKPFEDVVFTMQPGDTSGVVETQFGLHIIRLVEKRTINPNAYEAHQENIGQLLLETEMQQELPRWMNGLIAQADIEKRSCDLMSPALNGKAGAREDAPALKPLAHVSTDVDEGSAVEAQVMLPADTLRLWQEAWQKRDLPTYFSLYHGGQSPDKRFSSFAQWKAYKERAIQQHQDIHIDISNIQEEVLADHRVKISFDQRFKSNRLDDFDHKEMIMEKVQGSWKILVERIVK